MQFPPLLYIVHLKGALMSLPTASRARRMNAGGGGSGSRRMGRADRNPNISCHCASSSASGGWLAVAAAELAGSAQEASVVQVQPVPLLPACGRASASEGQCCTTTHLQQAAGGVCRPTQLVVQSRWVDVMRQGSSAGCHNSVLHAHSTCPTELGASLKLAELFGNGRTSSCSSQADSSRVTQATSTTDATAMVRIALRSTTTHTKFQS